LRGAARWRHCRQGPFRPEDRQTQAVPTSRLDGKWNPLAGAAPGINRATGSRNPGSCIATRHAVAGLTRARIPPGRIHASPGITGIAPPVDGGVKVE
jgi:hypothetical protein